MMYSNIVKSPAFPLGFRVSSQTQHFKLFSASKLHSLPIGSQKTMAISSYSHCRTLGLGKTVISSVSSLKSRRSFSNSSARRVDPERLPWLGSASKDFSKPGRSSWEQSARKLGNGGSAVKSSWEESAQRMERAKAKPSFGEPPEKVFDRSNRDTTWRRSPNREDLNRNGRGGSSFGGRESRNRISEVVEEVEEDEDEEEEYKPENEVVGDPRWDRIKSRFSGTMDRRGFEERPESRKWERQESWGRKTWKEATNTESTVPKMIGEGVYGIGPVLAALSAGRRELYALYVQEGLGVSNNARKKKDKKGIEKILKTAENLSLTIHRVSKHDLNMVVDSRPHQGIVLDASPLEMVKMMKLDKENDANALWVALDEVMDPMNLGAIVRSAYFFGAAGVILCAKNSAPLSGVVSKASAGSLELMELRYCKNMMQFLIFSAENGWRVLGGSVSPKAVPVNEIEPRAGPTILVLGSEGAGLRPLVEKSCTQLVRIPANVTGDMVVNHAEDGEEEGEGEKSGGVVGSAKDFRSFLAVESLNVSVAAGVLLHHLIGDSYYEKEIDGSAKTETVE